MIKVKSQLYSLGGRLNFDLDSIIGDCERISIEPEEGNWEKIPSLKYPRCLFSATAVKNAIFVYGGLFKPSLGIIGKIHHIEKLDISSPGKEWQDLKISNLDQPTVGCFMIPDSFNEDKI